jgi:hypothetical protein
MEKEAAFGPPPRRRISQRPPQAAQIARPARLLSPEATKAAVDAGKRRAPGGGKRLAAHVAARLRPGVVGERRGEQIHPHSRRGERPAERVVVAWAEGARVDHRDAHRAAAQAESSR